MMYVSERHYIHYTFLLVIFIHNTVFEVMKSLNSLHFSMCRFINHTVFEAIKNQSLFYVHEIILFQSEKLAYVFATHLN